MSTFPGLICLGEPMIEFDSRREGNSEHGVQGFGGGSRRTPPLPLHSQGASVGYLSAAWASDSMGDAFLALWKTEGSMRRGQPPSARPHRRLLRHPWPERPSVRLSAQGFGRVADDGGNLPADYIARARYFDLSAIGQAISGSARETCGAAVSAARAAA